MPSATKFIATGLIEATVRYDLPKEMSAGIGRIITRWSYAEDCVQRLVYEMVGANDTVGRIAIREPRLTDRLAMIVDLMAADGVVLPSDLTSTFKDMVKQAGDLGLIRDLCAHGAWSYLREHRSWCVTNTRGQWEGDALHHGLIGKKRIKPEGRLLSPEVLGEVCVELDDFIEKLRSLSVMVGIAYHSASLEGVRVDIDTT